MKKIIVSLFIIVVGFMLLSGCNASCPASDEKERNKTSNGISKPESGSNVGDKSTEDEKSVIFRGNLQRTGVYPSVPVREPATLAWKFKTEGGKNYISPPVIHNKTLYFACSDGNLFAVDYKTGDEKWKLRIGGLAWYVSIPVIDKEMVYISDGTVLHAIDITTGQVKWRHIGTGPPAVTNGIVFVGGWEWESEKENKGEYRRYYFYALDAQTGENKWKFAISGEMHISPAVGDGLVFIVVPDSTDTSLLVHAIEINSGMEMWRFQSDKGNFGQFSTPALYKDLVFVAGGDCDGIIYAIDKKTGRKVWQRLIYGTRGYDLGFDLAVDAGLVVLTGDYGAESIYVLDAETGIEKGKYVAISDGRRLQVVSSPIISEGVVYFGASGGRLYAVDLRTGEKRWSFSTGGPDVVSSPVVYDGTIYFGCEDGYLYALK